MRNPGDWLEFAACSTSPRVRGEVDLRAERLRSDASRVRGRFHKAQTRGDAPSPGFLRCASLRSESDLSPHAGRGGASGLRVPELITWKAYDLKGGGFTAWGSWEASSPDC